MLMTFEKAAEELAVSERTIRRLVATQELPLVPVGPKAFRIDSDDITTFIARVKRNSFQSGSRSGGVHVDPVLPHPTD
jgi:excisionase family DNA binding protein